MDRSDGQGQPSSPDASQPPADRWRFLRVVLPTSLLELLELACGVGAGLLTVAVALAPFRGDTLRTIAYLGVAAGLLTVAGAIVAVVRPDPAPPEPRQGRTGVHELPSSPFRFIGRRFWIARAMRHLRYRSNEAPVLAITGLPGVGKTGLAVVAGHRLSESDYPDNQLVFRLRRGGVVTPAAALYQALEKLGLSDAEIPATVEQRRNRYVQELQGTRSLILLDGATHAAQVLALWPPNGCAAIVTSRVELLEVIAAGARPLRLRPLTVLQALRFLANRIGRWRVIRQPVAALRLVNAYGRLPLLLGGLAARLAPASGRRLRLRDVLARLDDPGFQLDFGSIGDEDFSIVRGLTDVYEGLDGEQQRVILLLGVLGVDELDVELLAFVLRIPPERADVLLRELVDACLLEEIPGGIRTSWLAHELVRLFAGLTAQRPIEDEEERRRFQAWCEEVVDRAADVFASRIRNLRDLRNSPLEDLDPERAAALRADLEAAIARDSELATALVDRAVQVGLDLTSLAVGELVELLLEIFTVWPEIPHAPDAVESIRDGASRQGHSGLERRAASWLENHDRLAEQPQPRPEQPGPPAPPADRPPSFGPGDRDERFDQQALHPAEGSGRVQVPSASPPGAPADRQAPRPDPAAGPSPAEPLGRHRQQPGAGPPPPGAGSPPPGDGWPPPAGGPPPSPGGASPPPGGGSPPPPGGSHSPPPGGSHPPPGGSSPPPGDPHPPPSGWAPPPGWAPRPGGSRPRPKSGRPRRSAHRPARSGRRPTAVEAWRTWPVLLQLRLLGATRLIDSTALAALHCDLGERYERLGRLEQAKQHYRAGLDLLRERGDQEGVQRMLRRLDRMEQRPSGARSAAAAASSPATPTVAHLAGVDEVGASAATAAPELPSVAGVDEVGASAATAAPELPSVAEPDRSPSVTARWDATRAGFSDAELAATDDRTAPASADEPAAAPSSGEGEGEGALDHGIASMQEAYGGHSVPDRPIRFGDR
jgi:hypothetical protein